jgi:hypothetical protein
MGKPCWVILPALSAWMYGVNGDSAPFYPSMKLFRTPQGSCGITDATVQNVVDALVAQGSASNPAVLCSAGFAF